ncbi:merozoite surface protein CMZ-8-like [Salarias fasciatus]|uniref:merozoite surface protein CMZ-8-like n=1 Tax=Salarias fasciatus TaxID=181472 RepID=UPI001176AC16|nr:merozoite surface protein CMZ-8-like [Salarias fasciatus]
MGSTCISGVTLGDSEGLTVERSPSNQDQLIIDLTTPPASPTPTRSSPAFGSLWTPAAPPPSPSTGPSHAFSSLWTPAAPPPSPSTGPSHAFSSLWTPHTVGADRIAVVPPSRLNDPEREEEASGVASGVDREEEGGQQASAEDRSEDVRGD